MCEFSSKTRAAAGGTHKLTPDEQEVVRAADDNCNFTMSLIQLQSLIILLRNPAVRSPGSERSWLEEVLSAYADESSKLSVELQHEQGVPLISVVNKRSKVSYEAPYDTNTHRHEAPPSR